MCTRLVEMLSDHLSDPTATQIIVMLVAAGVFGAGHLASWDIEFPRSNGQILWRVCSILVLMSALGLIAANHICVQSSSSTTFDFADWAYIMFLSLYVMMRCLLGLLLVYSFSSLPSGAYTTKGVEWLDFVPFLH